ncbi:MAG: hypothetical protein Q9164_001748 [Protoblastenia rupestris]
MDYQGAPYKAQRHASPPDQFLRYPNHSVEAPHQRHRHNSYGRPQYGESRSPVPTHGGQSRLPLVQRQRSRGRDDEQASSRRRYSSSEDRYSSRKRERRRDSDAKSSTTSDTEEQRKKRNEKLLAASMACITTVAAANNIYQSTKAHETRRKDVREGKLSVQEAYQKRRKHAMLDLFSIGVAAIGINNARNGWKRVENCK